MRSIKIDEIKEKNSFDESDNRYIARCIKALQDMGAPLEKWVCTGITDCREDNVDAPLSRCEVCGCTKVRYEHCMEHEEFPFPVIVGCICAGIMQGNILKAKDDEKAMRNRSKRRRRFAEKKWRQNSEGEYFRRYRYHDIKVLQNGVFFDVWVDFTKISTYKGKNIDNILSAGYAAFDFIDPVQGQKA